MEKLIITAAICGAEVTKEHNPAVPYTVEEMVREAKSAFEAGAAVIHVHVRWDDGTPTQDKERFRVVLDAIREACPGVILIPSTGGATGMTPEERLQPTELFPEMATLDCGTCNFGDDIFVNDMPTMRAFGKRMLENNIKPEYECFEIGHLDTVLNMAAKGLVPAAPMQFNFVLGVNGCTPATVGNLDYLVNKIPAGSTWTVTGVGQYLKEQNPAVKVVAVEPKDSPVLSEGRSGAHKIQGIGAGFVPEVLDTAVYDEIIPVSNEDAFAAGRLVGRKEGILVGISSGAALHAAIQLAKRPENAGKTIVALFPDTGDRYLSTPLFED
jgi:3-keto-5-aminohexanoate cleavage enzyme